MFRTLLARPVPTAAFLVLNGVALLTVEHLTRRSSAAAGVSMPAPVPSSGVLDAPTDRLNTPTQVLPEQGRPPGGPGVGTATPEEQADVRLAALPTGRAVLIGAAQILALLPGISRSGVTIGAGLLGRLPHEDAARFAFLLSTPVILAAGVLKLGDLAGPAGDGVRGPVLLGSVLSGVGAYLSVRFLTGYFEHRSMRPFGVYCIVAGAACLAWFALR